MTKSEIAKKHIEILKKARYLIGGRENEYVCHAIEKITENCNHPLIRHIEKEIERAAPGCACISSFVKSKNLAVFLKLNDTCDGWKTYRLAWLDKWITDLEAYT